MNNIIGLEITDFNWGKGSEILSEQEIINFDRENDIQPFFDRNCKKFTEYSVSDEAVDAYLIKKYGKTAEDFCARFIFGGPNVDQNSR